MVQSESRNARGVIAENYRDLQSLGLIEEARFGGTVEWGSAESFVRTVLQAVELALYNAADLLRRGCEDVAGCDWDSCATKMSWTRGFHRVLVRLSVVGERYAAYARTAGHRGVPPARLGESPALREYRHALDDFAGALATSVASGTLNADRVLAEESLWSSRFLVLHITRIMNHESTIWERNLLAGGGPPVDVTYGAFTASTILRAAVHEHELLGDTYFTQFRGLHQIPELIAAEINERLEVSIRALRDEDLANALEQMVWINALTEPIAASLPPMVDSLSTHDYHQIRENLGLTSGSHSIGLRYHLFTDLYEQLCEQIAHYAEVTPSDPDANEEDRDYVPPRRVMASPSRASTTPIGPLLAQVLAFRSFVFNWRDEHQHLPRNNLGGGHTRSLTGSPDAVRVVRNMAEHARAHDPALALLGEERGCPPADLTAYLQSAGSIDDLLLKATGRVTQARFTDVQERLGFFANRCPFTKPERRVV